jgi:predicted ArsR family transcriptional regulator
VIYVTSVLQKNLHAAQYLRHNDVVKRNGAADAPARGVVSAAPAGTAGGSGASGGTSSAPTRGQVARLILELGPSTAATLGGRLGLTPAAIRRHLDNLLAEGLIETRTARTYGNRGRGRPAKVFVITDAGRSAFEHAYDDLASSALRFLAEAAGPEAIAEFARRQVSDLERRYAPAMARGELASRVQALAEALSADGYAASAGPAPAPVMSGGRTHGGGGEQLCQHHCPVAHVAAEFPQLCEAETEAFGRLLGTPVQRLATIAHGDGICTTHVTSVGKSAQAEAVVVPVTTENTQSPEGS